MYEKTHIFSDVNVKIHFNFASHGYNNEIFWFYVDEEIEKEYKEKFSEYEKNNLFLALNMSDFKKSSTISKRP